MPRAPRLSDYTSTWRCVDTANGSAVVASGNGATGTFTMPTAPVRSDILCTFTNVPKPPGHQHQEDRRRRARHLRAGRGGQLHRQVPGHGDQLR
ncbi:hypothetical protein G5V59_15675 [Nocardioides sp. W3-2-3]|uniref:hypothetical protein n=1 Tax=Nocardioides convexus TaxID=2712224 RepID=UPI002418157F|nr:hypothetical protein [Nocardioides convexus]NHA00873.1 hypothetical protein [Nocardioides convexus]